MNTCSRNQLGGCRNEQVFASLFGFYQNTNHSDRVTINCATQVATMDFIPCIEFAQISNREFDLFWQFGCTKSCIIYCYCCIRYPVLDLVDSCIKTNFPTGSTNGQKRNDYSKYTKNSCDDSNYDFSFLFHYVARLQRLRELYHSTHSAILMISISGTKISVLPSLFSTISRLV